MKVKKTNAIFIIYLLLFTFDSIVNYFVKLPIFVSGNIVILTFISSTTKFQAKSVLLLVVTISTFVLSFIFSNIRYTFNIKNLSDLTFILLLIIGSLYIYKNQKDLRIKIIHLFFLISLFLLSFSFFGINGEASTLRANTNDIEYLREYNQGFFRIAHVASYFFLFIALFYSFLFTKIKKNIYLAASILSITCVIFVGSRTALVSLTISIFLFFFKIRYIKYLILTIAIILSIVIFIDEILSSLHGNILYQYFSFVKTLISNSSRLSRIIIWSSWWNEVKSFSFFDFLAGRTFQESFIANLKNLKYEIWFHNDFLSIAYSYGLISLLFYLYAFISIYRRSKAIIRGNFWIFNFFFCILLSAFFNGFYYYYSFFIFYILFLMFCIEKGVSFNDESSNYRK